jgi:hypothetical protein
MTRMLSNEKLKKLKKIGLHYCKHYMNIVKYNPIFCDKCPYNSASKPNEI